MQRKISIALLVVLICTAGVVLYLSFGRTDSNENLSSDSASFSLGQKNKELTLAIQSREITIRNLTDEIVTYTITPYNSKENPIEKTLAPNSIDRFPSDVEMAVVFYKGEVETSYWLEPATPYSFRYDENDELELYQGSHGRDDVEDLAPFVPTPMIVVEKMLEMAEVDKNDIVYDLGCGDGRIVITAAKKYGARGVGIDIDPLRIEESEAGAKEAGVKHLVKFLLQDAMKADISEATVVTLYLLTKSNELLRPILERKLKPGTYVVSHNYSIPGWEEREVDFASVWDDEGEEHYVYLYRK